MVDNTGDEDWVDVDLALIAGLPVSFVHDLYNPRYMRRPWWRCGRRPPPPVIPEEAFGGAYADEGQDLLERRKPPPKKRSRAAFASIAAPAPAAMRCARR